MFYFEEPFIGDMHELELRSIVTRSDILEGEESEQIVKMTMPGTVTIIRNACCGLEMKPICKPTTSSCYVDDLFRGLENYFSCYEGRKGSSDNGYWQLTLKNGAGDEFHYAGLMDQDMSIGPDDEDDLSDLLRDAACDWDLFGFGSGKTGDSPDEILINIKKNGKEETFRSNYSDGEMSYEFTATGDARAKKLTIYDPKAVRGLFRSLKVEVLGEDKGEIDEPEDDYTFMVVFTWFRAGRNEYRSGIYNAHELPQSWPELMNMILQVWREETPEQHIFDPEIYGSS